MPPVGPVQPPKQPPRSGKVSFAISDSGLPRTGVSSTQSSKSQDAALIINIIILLKLNIIKKINKSLGKAVQRTGHKKEGFRLASKRVTAEKGRKHRQGSSGARAGQILENSGRQLTHKYPSHPCVNWHEENREIRCHCTVRSPMATRAPWKQKAPPATCARPAEKTQSAQESLTRAIPWLGRGSGGQISNDANPLTCRQRAQP